MCGITFEIDHELCGEGKHREETCINLRSDSMVRAKFPIRTGPAWELWPKPSCSERRPVPSSGTYIGWDDEAYEQRAVTEWSTRRPRVDISQARRSGVPASVTQIPLLGVNGSGIYKGNSSETMPKVSDPILPDDNITTAVFDDQLQMIEAQKNMTNLQYDQHIFYNSTFIGNETYFKEHWENITKTKADVHAILSNSHRRATCENCVLITFESALKDLDCEGQLSEIEGQTLRLSFNFPFYGHPLHNITVATGGFLYTGEHVHNWLAATQYIAPLMANFDTTLTNDSCVKLFDDAASNCLTTVSGVTVTTGGHVHNWLAATQYIAPLMANFDTTLTNDSCVKLFDDAASNCLTTVSGVTVTTGRHVHNWLAATQYIAPLMANFDTTLTNDSCVKLFDDAASNCLTTVSGVTVTTGRHVHNWLAATQYIAPLMANFDTTLTNDSCFKLFDDAASNCLTTVSGVTVTTGRHVHNWLAATQYIAPLMANFDTTLTNDSCFKLFDDAASNCLTTVSGVTVTTGRHVHNWLAATQYIAPLMANFDTTLTNDSCVKLFDDAASNCLTTVSGVTVTTGEHVHNWLAATQYIAPQMANFDTTLTNDSCVKLFDDGEKFTALWENVNLREDKAKNFTFAVTLYKNGDIVFAYKDIPVPVQLINDNDHPVKVGLSDAYRTDKMVFLMRRKTIYEYHRVSFKTHNITSNTVLRMVALPTCLQYDTCESCANHETEFNCSWCEQVRKCSSGTDRNKQDWMARSCEKLQIVNATQCPASKASNVTGDQYFTDHETGTGDHVVTIPEHVPSGLAVRAPAAPPAPAPSPIGAAVSAFAVIALVAALAAWLVYAFKNPHTRSGQMLIKYRPSQWSWRRGEARYTAATIHM
ncbi:hypothetical protein MSG28_001242 [Choristoneura fumiferana]|uniref:Uncharacterized protein n=1 Tax=Choristoneura fumiferana TaxID=7141 RepID=A0ACC0K4A6_CHOFU|nr:hypothetical protein MSG28_001242 [Choristoneura fumiferana]